VCEPARGRVRGRRRAHVLYRGAAVRYYEWRARRVVWGW
jgi:hypothetical protein